MAQGTLWFQPIQHVFSAAVVVPGAKALFYAAGTSTPVNVYSDVGLTTPITQPVVADSNGVFVEIFLTPGSAYKVDLQTSAGVSLTGYPADNQLAIPAGTTGLDQTETAGEAIGAGLAAYLSDGSGGKNAGQLYKADSANPYSSTLPLVGMVPIAILSGAQGTFRVGGQVTGLSVNAGSDYYVGTSGALTTTAPSNARLLGRADSATSLIVAPNPRAVTNPTLCQGRLTLTTATPVTTGDVTGATSIFFTPYQGNQIAVFDGTSWSVMTFTEISLALGTLTGSLPYDVFCFNNSGTLALEFLAWTNGTTRATALAVQNGIYVKTGATTRRYLGTFYTDSTTQTSDAAAGSATSGRHLWNYYNRQRRVLTRLETTASWTYQTATVRQANGSTANQVQVIIGVQEAALHLQLSAMNNNTIDSTLTSAGIGEDSLTTYAVGTEAVGAAVSRVPLMTAALVKLPTVGHHIYSWNEWSTAAGTTTWYGQSASAGSTISHGLTGWIEG